MQSALCLLLLCPLCLAAPSENANFVVRPRARAQLQQLIDKHDADKDVYTLLSETQRLSWGTEARRSIADFRAQLSSVPTRVLVEVKLVGFDGSGGEEGLAVAGDELLKHLQSLRRELGSVVLQPEVKQLATKPTVEFEVTHASRSLLDKVNYELARAGQAEKARPGRRAHEFLRINYKALDRPLQEDAVASRAAATAAVTEGVAALTVYLVNPRPPGDKLEEYLYSYEEPGEDKLDDSRSCPGTLYVSSTAPAYVWIDIRAGPSSYGPGAGHRGQVHAHSLPHPLHYKKHLLPQAIIPDLAALVWSAAQHMAWPPMLHTEVPTKPDVLVHVIHIHDTLGPPADRVDQDAIHEMLQQAVGDMQQIEMKETFLAFAHCDLCTTIFASALKVRTARAEGNPYMQASTSRMLDRLVLHKGLSEHMEAILTGFPTWGGYHDDQGSTETRHVLPVVVFDVSDGGDEGLLIDGLVKATAFSDMVIAVSSQARHAPTHFKCRWTSSYPSADNVTREILGAALSSGWGVPDTATYYSAGAGEGEDYRWSVGNTPFGPLSYRLSVNAAQAQVARRNLIVSHLEASIARISRVLDAFAAVSGSGRLDPGTTHEHQNTVLQRLNIAHYKLSEAARLLGQWQATAAFKMARSLRRDVEALEAIGRSVSLKLDSHIQCTGATTVWSVWWAPAGAVALWPLALWVRRRIYGRGPPKLEKIY